MAELRVKVGASTDASFDQVLRSLQSSSASASRMLEAQAKRTYDLQSALLKSKWDQEKKILQAQLTETAKVNDQSRRLDLAASQARIKNRAAEASKTAQLELAAATELARRKSEIEIAQAKETARKERELAVVSAREAARDARSASRGSGGGIDTGYRMGYWSMRNFSPVTPMLSMAGRLSKDIIGGAGIDMSLGSMVGKNISLEQAAIQLSNQGFQANKTGAKGTRQDFRALMGEARQVGKEFGFDPSKVMEASTKFVDLTGDLEQARASMAGLASLSNATTSDLTEMSAAAASVSVQLERSMGGDAQSRAKALQNIMRVFAGQGKEGAVEIKDFASQMAKVATVTNRFAGDRENIFSMVGVLAQESRKAGGSASAAQAATSVSRFATNIPKDEKKWRAMGINVWANEGKTLLRNPQELIMEALSATQGSQPKMQKLFGNVMSGRAVQGFTDVFNMAGGGKAGMQAVVDEFESLQKAALTENEERENNAKVMESAAKRAQVFQNNLQEAAEALSQRVLPELEKLAPKFIEVTEAAGEFVAWIAGNPLQGAVALLGASIAKAGVEQVVRAGIETAFSNVSMTGGFAIAAATLTITSATLLVQEMKKREEGANERESDIMRGIERETGSYQVARGKLNEAKLRGRPQSEIDAAEREVEEARAKLLYLTEQGTGELGTGKAYADKLKNPLIPTALTSALDPHGKVAAEQFGRLVSVLERATAILDSGQELPVKIRNWQDAPTTPVGSEFGPPPAPSAPTP